MATLTAQLEAETRIACRTRLDAHLDDAVHAGLLDQDTRARLGADQASGHLSRLLRIIEQDGRDPRHVLHHALAHGKTLIDTRSPAQVISHRITHGRPDHDLTGPAPAAGTVIPAGLPEPVTARLRDLQEQVAARTTQLGRQTADQAPEWAVRALGPVPAPTDVADRADWEHRAGLVAAHRETVADTHPTRALDRMPGLTTTERRPGYTAAWNALGRPEHNLDEAAMTDGRLRVRIQAWDREQAWQPPYVDNHLRAAETDLQAARQAAAIAGARATQADTAGDPDQATKWRDQADQHRATADMKTLAVQGLTHASQTYREWATATLVTRDRGERARVVAEQRGLNLDARHHDTTTAEDWLTHHQAANHRRRRTPPHHRKRPHRPPTNPHRPPMEHRTRHRQQQARQRRTRRRSQHRQRRRRTTGRCGRRACPCQRARPSST